LGQQDILELGDLNTERDWSYAGDIVNAIWLMMNADEAKDYVLASGRLHTVENILEIAFDHVGLNYRDYVKVDSALRRSPEGLPLCGDSSKVREELAWKPAMNFESMIRMMVDTDLGRLRT
jgi:GDPmannose 4,6-dehydratase